MFVSKSKVDFVIEGIVSQINPHHQAGKKKDTKKNKNHIFKGICKKQKTNKKVLKVKEIA